MDLRKLQRRVVSLSKKGSKGWGVEQTRKTKLIKAIYLKGEEGTRREGSK